MSYDVKVVLRNHLCYWQSEDRKEVSGLELTHNPLCDRNTTDRAEILIALYSSGRNEQDRDKIILS